jgi:hypothetical protein
VQVEAVPTDSISSRRSLSSHRSLARVFAIQDLIAIGYLTSLGVIVAVSPGEAQPQVLLRLLLCTAVVVVGAVIGRAATELPQVVRLNVYRLALALTVVESYLMLRDLLPLVRSDAVDASLLALDRWALGFEPALWLERFNTFAVVEWFSFFYFSYFFICAAYLVGVLWLSRPSRHTTVFAVGSLIVLFVGHLGYLAVPGYGPVAHLEETYAGPIRGGFFWHCVQSTVAAAGAQKDIFPSLHTALPTWFTLYAAYRARHDERWRLIALVTGFFAANIIASTMLLRWHYAIDVVAGLSLAGLAATAAPRIAERESRWRIGHGLPSPWPTPQRSGERLPGLPSLEVELEPAGER